MYVSWNCGLLFSRTQTGSAFILIASFFGAVPSRTTVPFTSPAVAVSTFCPAGQSRHAAPANRLSARHAVADPDVEGRQVAVKRRHAPAVIDDDAVAVDAEPARVQHLAGVGGDNRDAARRGEVEPEVDLLID